MAFILVVDPDPVTRAAVAASLSALGHDVAELEDGTTALAAHRERHPDLIMIECDLPDLPGLDVLTDIKGQLEMSHTRVVMVGERASFGDLASALDAGADDVVAKPVDREELLARVSACLRRPPVSLSAGELRIGGISIDNVGHRVAVNDEAVVLAPREYHLLLFFIENRERVFSREQLLSHVWGKQAAVGVRTVDVHVRRLRSLLEPYGYDTYLQTVRGAGYRFSPE